MIGIVGYEIARDLQRASDLVSPEILTLTIVLMVVFFIFAFVRARR